MDNQQSTIDNQQPISNQQSRIKNVSDAPVPMSAAGAGAGYTLITALLFHELLPDVTTHLYSDLGDPLLNASILEWSARHVPMSEAWWNFPSFAPLSGVTAFTEHLLAA